MVFRPFGRNTVHLPAGITSVFRSSSGLSNLLHYNSKSDYYNIFLQFARIFAQKNYFFAHFFQFAPEIGHSKSPRQASAKQGPFLLCIFHAGGIPYPQGLKPWQEILLVYALKLLFRLRIIGSTRNAGKCGLRLRVSSPCKLRVVRIYSFIYAPCRNGLLQALQKLPPRRTFRIPP